MKKTIAFLLSTCFMVGIAIAQTPTPRPATMPSIQAQRINAQSPAEAEKACPHHAQHHDQASMPQHQCKNQCDQHKGDKQCKGDCDQHKGDKQCKGNCDQHKGPQPGNHCDKGGCKEGKRGPAVEFSVGLSSMNALNNSALSLLSSYNEQYQTIGTEVEIGYRFRSQTSLSLRCKTASYNLANAINEEVDLGQIALIARAYYPLNKKTTFLYGVGLNTTFRSNYYDNSVVISPTATVTNQPLSKIGLGTNFECGIERQLDRGIAVRVVAYTDFSNTETFSSLMNNNSNYLAGTPLESFAANPYRNIITAGIRCDLSLFVPTQKKK